MLKAYGAPTIEDIKKTTNCDSERCIVEKAIPIIGDKLATAILHRNFKVDGPNNSDLLSNIDIDSVLQQWAQKWTDFFPYNFNMLNYASYSYRDGRLMREPDTLATILVEDLYKKGYRTCACVINSDIYQNGGKHWMALFADARNTSHATIEFFNSSGRPPAPEWVNWMVKSCTGIRNAGIKKVEMINCTAIEHQDSLSECGVYSLYYIWCRLNGVPAKTFTIESIPDEKMFEFRQHLFAKPIGVIGGTFNWDEFKKIVPVKWA
jgi:hypothetical protein